MDAIALIAMLNMILTNIKNPDFVITESQKQEINVIIDNLDNLKKLENDSKGKTKVNNTNIDKKELKEFERLLNIFKSGKCEGNCRSNIKKFEKFKSKGFGKDCNITFRNEEDRKNLNRPILKCV